MLTFVRNRTIIRRYPNERSLAYGHPSFQIPLRQCQIGGQFGGGPTGINPVLSGDDLPSGGLRQHQARFREPGGLGTALGQQKDVAFLLQLADGGVKGLLGQAGELANDFQGTLAACVQQGIEDVHGAVRKAHAGKHLMVDCVRFCQKVVDAEQGFGRMGGHRRGSFHLGTGVL